MEEKICFKCKSKKLFSEFNKRKKSLDGYNTWCRVCTKIKVDKYRNKNKKRINELKINRYYKNIDRNREKHKLIAREKYSERIDYHKEYVQTNRKRITEYQKQYRVKNKKKINAQRKEYLESNELLQLRNKLRSRILAAIKNRNWIKNSSTEQLVGAPFKIVKLYLERQFKKGMSWANHGNGNGKWNIDHKIPLASAKTEEELIVLFHYRNLQPLWWMDNKMKAAKILPIQTSLII